MKKNSILICFALTIGALLPGNMKAQVGPSGSTASQVVNLQVSGAALLAVEGGEFSLSLAGAGVAGEALDKTATNSASRLRISSLVKDAEKNKITAQINTATVDMTTTNTTLTVWLGDPNGNFHNFDTEGGTLKTKAEVTPLSTTAQPIATGIKTCWSGTASGDGYILNYEYASTGAGTPKSTKLTIMYTILADS